MKLKHVLFGICLFFANSSFCTFIDDVNDLGIETLKTVGSSAKLISCLYFSTYFCTLAHEYGHAFTHKLLFPNRKIPKVIIGPYYCLSYPSDPYPRVTLFNGQLVLGRNILTGGITLPSENISKDAIQYPKSHLCISFAGPLAGTLTSIIGYKCIMSFLRNVFPNTAESLRLTLTSCLLLNFCANMINLLPYRGSDGYHIKEILKQMFSSNQIKSFNCKTAQI